MKTDLQIQKDVMDELSWRPELTPSQIGVSVRNGVVTLSGQVDSYSKKLAAESAAKRVSGVKALAEDIQVGVSFADRKTDAEIATAALSALKWHSPVQDEKVRLTVENGNITLEGEVEWEYQRYNTAVAVQNLVGVKAVLNHITVKPKLSAEDIKKKITSALQRSATVDASRVKVETTGDKVILKGWVRSLAEKDDAAIAAWNAPGVRIVDNKIDVETPEFAFGD